MGDGADEEEALNRCRRGRDSRQVEGGRPRAYQDEELPGLAGYGECVVSTAPSLLADPCLCYGVASFSTRWPAIRKGAAETLAVSYLRNLKICRTQAMLLQYPWYEMFHGYF